MNCALEATHGSYEKAAVLNQLYYRSKTVLSANDTELNAYEIRRTIGLNKSIYSVRRHLNYLVRAGILQSHRKSLYAETLYRLAPTTVIDDTCTQSWISTEHLEAHENYITAAIINHLKNYVKDNVREGNKSNTVSYTVSAAYLKNNVLKTGRSQNYIHKCLVSLIDDGKYVVNRQLLGRIYRYTLNADALCANRESMARLAHNLTSLLCEYKRLIGQYISSNIRLKWDSSFINILENNIDNNYANLRNVIAALAYNAMQEKPNQVLLDLRINPSNLLDYSKRNLIPPVNDDVTVRAILKGLKKRTLILPNTVEYLRKIESTSDPVKKAGYWRKANENEIRYTYYKYCHNVYSYDPKTLGSDVEHIARSLFNKGKSAREVSKHLLHPYIRQGKHVIRLEQLIAAHRNFETDKRDEAVVLSAVSAFLDPELETIATETALTEEKSTPILDSEYWQIVIDWTEEHKAAISDKYKDMYEGCYMELDDYITELQAALFIDLKGGLKQECLAEKYLKGKTNPVVRKLKKDYEHFCVLKNIGNDDSSNALDITLNNIAYRQYQDHKINSDKCVFTKEELEQNIISKEEFVKTYPRLDVKRGRKTGKTLEVAYDMYLNIMSGKSIANDGYNNKTTYKSLANHYAYKSHTSIVRILEYMKKKPPEAN